MTGMPTYEDEEPDLRFPGLDMVGLAEQVRTAEPGGAEEVVSVVMD